MSFLKANLVALIYPLPFVLIFVAAYFASDALRPGSSGGIFLSFSGNIFLLFFKLLLYFAAFIVLVALHEGIHALFFLKGCEFGRKSIIFGIKSATPYCHCEEVLAISVYRQSLLAPLWLICIPLAAASCMTGSSLIFLVTLTMIFGSGGDLAIFWMIRRFRSKTTYVWDMEDQVGCIIYEPVESPEISTDGKHDIGNKN
jgi:hypothetical protein